MDDTPRLLKAFVILGGALLLAGTVLLVVLLVLRMGDRATVVQLLPTEVALPAGARVQQIALDGERLMLLVVNPEGRQTLIVVDAVSGDRLGLLELRPEE